MTAVVDEFASRVVRWQKSHGRHDLPWQNTRDPYRVWLSEIMLQQTQVSAVKEYFARFLARCPDVGALAAATEDDVLALWSGLGYYSRARNLHRCARQVVEVHRSEFPRTAEELQTLPGIGRSTAAAIAAFCFGERVAILDGNVKRVLTRVLGFQGDLAVAAETERLWAAATTLLPETGIEAYTQGLMDLGATICLTRRPRCEACPLAADCVARAQGRQADYPVKTRKLRRGARQHAWLWLQRGESLWLVQRPQQGVWAGLWSLPEFDSEEAMREALAALPGEPQALPAIRHTLTHFDWTLQPWHWPLPQRLPAAATALLALRWPEGRWVAPEQALAMGIPTPLRRLLNSIGTS